MAERPEILMCPPTYFAVGYAINPWMHGNVGQLDKALAMRQWNQLHDEIATVADVVLMEPQPGLPDMVFTANAGTVYRDHCVVSRFYHEERVGEEAHFARFFREHGLEVLELPEDLAYEGAGDSLIDRSHGWLWAGYGFRTDLSTHGTLADWLGVDVLSIRLVDPRFYHIDTCFCPLAGGYLLYHPPAFSDESQRLIEARVPSEKRIEVNVRDAGNFACNAVNVGRKVFLNQASATLRARLEKRGFEVVQVALTEFLKSGGSAKCLTLKLTEPDSTEL